MKQRIKGERSYLQSAAFSETGKVCHGFTGRLGGVSRGKISGLNLGFRVGDNPDSVQENYRLAAEDLSMPPMRIVAARQTHTDHILVVDEKDAGKGVFRESDIFDTDGLVTACKNLPLMVFAADCVPILLFDPVREVIAAVHSGWRGTVQNIGGKAVKLMETQFGVNPENILAAIGPSIGPCCFTFGKADAEVFPKRYRAPQDAEKVLIDIWAMNRDLLTDAGVLPGHIDCAEVCTVCHQDEYYSYRVHKEHTGRQGAVIMLKE